MPGCSHATLELVGEQKTDDGVNTYHVCKDCRALLVVTPTRTVIAIKGARGAGHSTLANATQS